MSKSKPYNFRPYAAVAEKVQNYMNTHKCSSSEAINALLSMDNQIEPQVEVIRDKDHPKVEALKEVLKVRDEYAEKQFQRELKLKQLSAAHTPPAEKVDWGAGHGGIDTGVILNPHPPHVGQPFPVYKLENPICPETNKTATFNACVECARHNYSTFAPCQIKRWEGYP